MFYSFFFLLKIKFKKIGRNDGLGHHVGSCVKNAGCGQLAAAQEPRLLLSLLNLLNYSIFIFYF